MNEKQTPDVEVMIEQYYVEIVQVVKDYCQKTGLYPWEVDLLPRLKKNDSGVDALTLHLTPNGIGQKEEGVVQ